MSSQSRYSLILNRVTKIRGELEWTAVLYNFIFKKSVHEIFLEINEITSRLFITNRNCGPFFSRVEKIGYFNFARLNVV